MTLCNTKRVFQKQYAFLKEIFDGPEVLNRIHLVKISSTTFTIEYDFKDREIVKKKTYIR